MKRLFPVFALAALFICACQATAPKQETVSAKPSPTEINPDNNKASSSSSSNEVTNAEQAQQIELEAQNEKFKIVPEDFKQIDFKNFSYPFGTLNGKKINVALKNGEHEVDSVDDKGWIRLQDTYFVDLTNDGRQEAIIVLSHVTCGGSCDGGAALIFIYSIHQNGLKKSWQYETGSLGYGCGLKSLAVKNRRLTLELFGRCPGAESDPLTVKFQVKDTTRLTFGFNGRKFVEESKQIISVPVRSVLGHNAEISIEE